MFIFTVKASTLKYVGVMALSAVAIVLTVAFLPTDNVFGFEGSGAVVEASVDFESASTGERRVLLLEGFGWEVDPSPISSREVIIPERFDGVFEKYNEIQKSQGLDLSKYKGKSVMQYTYRIINHDYDGGVVANLLVYKNKVIGGDVSSAVADGFIQGFEKNTAEKS